MSTAFLVDYAGLAHRRYPDVPLELAIEFFASDRRHAGQGALRESSRGQKREPKVQNIKRYDLVRDGYTYWLIRCQPERYEFPPFDFRPPGSIIPESVTVTRLPAKAADICLRFARRQFQSRAGRDAIARELRKARRRLRESLNSA